MAGLSLAAPLIAFGIEGLAWLWSLQRRDASVADLAWGPIFIAPRGDRLAAAPRDALGLREIVGASLVILGLAIETVADAQLARWKRPGEVVDRGLSAWSRHPNYFGECLARWGFGVLGLTWWSGIGPALMTFLLLRVSGVTLLERTIAERRPAYAAYRRRVSAFVPRPPRSP